MDREIKRKGEKALTRFLKKNLKKPVRELFCNAPNGPTNILAIECSNPSAAKIVMIIRIATALDTKSAAAVEHHTALQTNQLHTMPLATATPNGREAFASATAVKVPAACEKTPA